MKKIRKIEIARSPHDGEVLWIIIRYLMVLAVCVFGTETFVRTLQEIFSISIGQTETRGVQILALSVSFYLFLVRPIIPYIGQSNTGSNQFQENDGSTIPADINVNPLPSFHHCMQNSSEEGFMQTDVTGICIYANDMAWSILGYDSEDEIVGKHLHQLVHHTHEDGSPYLAEECPVCLSSRRGSGLVRVDAETFWKKDGTKICVEIRSYPNKNKAGRPAGAFLFLRPANEKKKVDEKIRHLAFNDTLTGLANRESLKERIQQALALAERKGHYLSVMFLDLDRFKNINDSLGHDIGDALLQEVSKELQMVVRKSDTVARWGGDEFVVLLPVIEDFNGAATVAEKILKIFETPFEINGKKVMSGTSVGIAMYPENGRDHKSLLKNADAAMYAAKNSGRGNYQFFSKEIRTKIEKRVALETDLRRALEYNELELYYQPIFDTRRHAIHGVEALLRWNHPQKGQIPPSEFLPVAEEAGLIMEIGRIVIAQACTQLLYWRSNPDLPEISMAINVSSHLFLHPEFISLLETSMRATGLLDAGLVELEVSERTIMEVASHDLLLSLEKLNVSLSVDDFGTGFSSLTYLKHFPISKLKIDRSLLEEYSQNSSEEVIVKAIIAMTKALGLKVVAEGVETEEQIVFLCSNGCDQMQGYYFAHPMPASNAEQYIASWKAPETSICNQIKDKKKILNVA